METTDNSASSLSLSIQAQPSTVAMRTYLSSQHLWGARHFIELAKRMEDEHTGRSTFNIQHRAYVLGAIMSAGAFFDAAINEIYQDAKDCHDSYIKPLGIAAICKLSRKWDSTEGKGKFMPSMKKYQEALECIGYPRFDLGRAPYQDAAFAIELRNAMVHYKPETLTSNDQSKFEKDLRNKLKGKYPMNMLMRGSANPNYPDYYLGYGFSTWVLDALLAFADEFFQKIGIPPNYQKVVFNHSYDQPI